jgi:hypothetical protein
MPNRGGKHLRAKMMLGRQDIAYAIRFSFPG